MADVVVVVSGGRRARQESGFPITAIAARDYFPVLVQGSSGHLRVPDEEQLTLCLYQSSPEHGAPGIFQSCPGIQIYRLGGIYHSPNYLPT